MKLYEKDLRNFKIKFIKHNDGIYMYAILESLDKRYIINAKDSELFDKKIGKCYKLDSDTMEMIDSFCRLDLMKSL